MLNGPLKLLTWFLAVLLTACATSTPEPTLQQVKPLAVEPMPSALPTVANTHTPYSAPIPMHSHTSPPVLLTCTAQPDSTLQCGKAAPAPALPRRQPQYQTEQKPHK